MTSTAPSASTNPSASPPAPTAQTPPDDSLLTGPLTEPAELIALLGRFGACVFLFITVIVTLFARAWYIGIGVALFALFYQRATYRMWRRLRDERLAKEAARAEAAGAVRS